jgi:ribosomal protein L11 methylase PrmA
MKLFNYILHSGYLDSISTSFNNVNTNTFSFKFFSHSHLNDAETEKFDLIVYNLLRWN